MKERIEKFLRLEGISSAKFADELGIQRSSVSHILSGRNNPSLELIQKFLKRYDKINTDWLILGKGEMYRSDKNISNLSLFDTMQPESLKIEQIIEKNSESKAPIIDPNTNIKQQINAFEEKTDKRIIKIVTFYTDKTFDEYLPSK